MSCANAAQDTSTDELGTMMSRLGASARSAQAALATSSSEQRNRALTQAAAALRNDAASILEANRQDLDVALQRKLTAAMTDRLMLDAERIEAMAVGLESIARLPDPLGRTLASWQRPNGLKIERVSVPLGVIGIIYESRPNVTADAAALCVKSGNAVILRGGSESFHSSTAIHGSLLRGLANAGIDDRAVQMVPTTDRAAVGYLLSSMSSFVDVVVPRGGKRLIERVSAEARVPVIGHLEGICHVYVHASADPAMAVDIATNSKLRRTGICGAAETLLIDRAIAESTLPAIAESLAAGGCRLIGDADCCRILPDAEPATDADWTTEYLDAVLSIRIVDGIDDAVSHIATYGSGHTESIVASDSGAAEHFLRTVDSAIVLHNASTQFADGGEFGMGAEIGISTGRIHARGPVGTEQLTSFKYIVRGEGQLRP